mmetsp:Transcript_11563/g.27170  ORF Transcript_11563/g.27170 Transcript_11563/m.27170 type:complete len:385 (+) Transcript_11563:317-1471(+)
MPSTDLELLTSQEREWAFALEEAMYGERFDKIQERRWSVSRRSSVDSTNLAKNLRAATQLYGKPSDFEIVAHALRAKGNISKALHRLKRMKMFKDAYNIPEFDFEASSSTSDPVEPILKLMKKFLIAYPEFIKKIGMDKYGRVAVQFQLSGLRWSLPAPFNHTEAERFQALYYLLHVTQPTLESIRRGTVWIGDLVDVTERPSPPLYRGGRMLLRDSYPIKVEDVPVVDCPPTFSKVYATTYPFLSSHFVAKFVRVTPEVLRSHFPPELLSDRLLGNNHAKIRSTNRRRLRHKAVDENDGINNNLDVVAIVTSSTGDEYDNSWENLDDDEDDEEYYNSSNHRSSGTQSTGDETDQYSDDSEELWTRIERLLRMRFKTEQAFQLV